MIDTKYDFIPRKAGDYFKIDNTIITFSKIYTCKILE
jgi:hypothetical protein